MNRRRARIWISTSDCERARSLASNVMDCSWLCYTFGSDEPVGTLSHNNNNNNNTQKVYVIVVHIHLGAGVGLY